MDINLKTPIEKMFIPSRAKNSLISQNIIYVEDLLLKTKAELRKMPNLGEKSINEICILLSIHGFSLLNDSKSINDYFAESIKLSLKDQFAQNALQGLLAHSGTHNDRTLVVAAYDYAEMMMEERNARN